MADDVQGKLTHLGGKIKEGVGELLGDRSVEREGRLDQMEGRAEQDAARAEDAMLDANARRVEAQRAKDLNRDLDDRGL
ncbi:CsbD family protein [Longimicrobium sp.]|uniref:CsbD family protein n=1 Tax=Longimicrobium sp. TaxID=2029185 RepID=UPI002C22779C|nr:CsbD family protein [Longimicrobium sp.]HSU17630.1 CsbD family protein [Longimicrobium sp.]